MEKYEKADAVAHQIATSALLQTLYGALMGASSKAEFRQIAQALEAATVRNLEALAVPNVPAETENYVQEAASGYVSRFFATIQPPPHLP